jgi:hypothetical protein
MSKERLKLHEVGCEEGVLGLDWVCTTTCDAQRQFREVEENVETLLPICELILKEWERPTEGVLPGELIARLSQYAQEAREAIRKVKGNV